MGRGGNMRHCGDGEGAAAEPREDAPGAAADAARGRVAQRMLPARHHREHPRRRAGAAPIAGFVAYAPEGGEALFDGMLAPGTQLVLADGSIDVPPGVNGFGRSLLHAATALLAQGYGAACLVNSDSPTLPTAFLRASGGSAGTAGRPDGAGRRRRRRLLPDRPQGAARRAVSGHRLEHRPGRAQTLAQAATLGLEVVTLPTWFDVDDAASLTRLVDDLTAAREATDRRRTRRRRRESGSTRLALVNGWRPARQGGSGGGGLATRQRHTGDSEAQDSRSPLGRAGRLGGGIGAARSDPSL